MISSAHSSNVPTWMTTWSLLGLGAGLALGVVCNLGWATWIPSLARWLEPLLKRVEFQLPDLNNEVPENPRYGIHDSRPIHQLPVLN